MHEVYHLTEGRARRKEGKTKMWRVDVLITEDCVHKVKIWSGTMIFQGKNGHASEDGAIKWKLICFRARPRQCRSNWYQRHCAASISSLALRFLRFQGILWVFALVERSAAKFMAKSRKTFIYIHAKAEQCQRRWCSGAQFLFHCSFGRKFEY